MKVIDIIHDCKDRGITSYSGIDVNLLFSSEFLNLSIDDCIRIICNEGHLLLLIFLIFAGAKIKCIIKDGILIYNCNNYIAILLINNCINIDAKDIYGRTTLSWLCTQDNNDIFLRVMQKSSNIDTTDYMGRSPLSYACQYNNKYATEILIKNKANVDMIDNSGNSLLYYSYLRESNDIFRLLLENNANPNILNNDNKTLLDIMIDMYGFYETTIMNIILDYDAIYNQDYSDENPAIIYIKEYIHNKNWTMIEDIHTIIDYNIARVCMQYIVTTTIPNIEVSNKRRRLE
jgi:hypothetical protein